MKTIKFRGYDTRDGVREMVTFTLDELLAGTDDYELVDPDSVVQLVGYDKDNNEIYEGDVIKSRFGSSCYANFRHYGEIIDGAYSLVQTRIIN